MRYSLILIILFYSHYFGQTTIFVKYHSQQDKTFGISQIEEVNKQNLLKGSISQSQLITVSSISQQFRLTNPDLDNIIKLEFQNSDDAKYFVENIQSKNAIEYIQSSNIYSIDYTPSDSLYNQQWGLLSINAPEAWELVTPSSKEIIIAVIDTGLDITHPDITNSIYYNKKEMGIDDDGNDKRSNGIDDDNNGFIDDYQGWDFVDKINIFPDEVRDDFLDWDNEPIDEHGHGTNITGVISAMHNSFGIAGINPNVRILNLRAFDKNGNGEEDDAASAIIYAVNMGASIINMSWGDEVHSQLLKDVINFAYENNVILIGSAGNSSSNLPHYPSGFSQVISVGAIQKNEALASFSNFGSSLDLVAPGSQIFTTHLHYSYKAVSGTSIAAPFVSAAASFIVQLEDFSNEEVKQILKSTAKDLGASGWDESFGAGTLDLAKALTILSPAEIKINSPTQDFHTLSDKLLINVTCLSPYFKDYKLFYGIGYNPTDWEPLVTENQQYQILNEDILNLDISSFADTSYTIRLVLNRTDNKTQEERINFVVDRSAPKIENFNISPAMLNNSETIQAAIKTDDLTTAQLYFRKINSENNFSSIIMDGYLNNISSISSKHFAFLPIEEIDGGIDHEIFIRVTNQSGLSTDLLNNSDYFYFTNSVGEKYTPSITKNYDIPNGRVFSKAISLSGIDEKFLLLNNNNTSKDISFFKFSNNLLVEEGKLLNKIPIAVNDFNLDGKTDILNLFVKNGYIDSQELTGQLVFNEIYADSSNAFWPAFADDIDEDGKFEIIVFSSDTSITIWEVNQNFTLNIEATLNHFADISERKGIFRNNIVLFDNFDDDHNKEIVTIDNLGRLILYEVNGNDNYTNDAIIEILDPVESNSSITKGDYNGDGKIDIAVLMEFEENVFLTPLIYSSVVNYSNGKIDILFQNMFISTESNYSSTFDKQYKALKLVDVNQNGTDDFISFTYPNAHIFEYNEEKSSLIFYQSNVNSQAIFSDDLDDNGVEEIGIPNGSKILFHEFNESSLISPPIFTDYYSIDNNHIYIEWKENELPVYIFRAFETGSLKLIDSTHSNLYIDSVSSVGNYKYSLVFYDEKSKDFLSLKTGKISIFTHNPHQVNKVITLNSNSIMLSFSGMVSKTQLFKDKFIIDGKEPSSVAIQSEFDIILTLNEELSIGEHSLEVKNLRDYLNAPIQDTLINFDYLPNANEETFLYIQNYEILNNNNLLINFNLPLDSVSALNTTNYSFSPYNKVNNIILTGLNSIRITSENPFGSIGKEYVLKIDNILSSNESGNLSINQNSGSEIVLTNNADNLSEMYVFPNPGRIMNSSFITFANLPSKVEIHIFSIDGVKINVLHEEDGNGGITWNMRDINQQKIDSGIYIYKAISLDNFDSKLEEKIGKFAVIK